MKRATVLTAGLLVASILEATSGCSLFTDFGKLSAGGAARDAATNEAPDDAQPGRDAGDEGDAAGVVDAAGGELPFRDAFDDPTPLPRAWTAISGTPAIDAIADAPTPPSALHVASGSATPAESALQKQLSLGAKSSVTCSFAVRLMNFVGADQYLKVATLRFSTNEPLQIDVTPNEWHFYGQLGGVEISGGAFRTMTDTWVRLSVTVGSDGAVTVVGGADVRTARAGGPSFANMWLSVGLVGPVQSGDYEAAIDDVACTAK